MEARVRAFLKFLEPRRVKKGEPFTHTSKANQYAFWYPGKYYIGRNDREEFEELYQKLVRHGISVTLTERPEKYGPLRVDADFKASLDQGTERQYTDSTLQGLIGIYQQEIRKIIDPDIFEDKMLWCMVLEKECPRVEDGIIKDGFHLHFPHFICDAWTQDVYLRNQVTKRMTNEGVWKGCTFITKLSSIIDTGIAKKQWMLYGSMNYKGETSTAYKYTKRERQGIIYNHSLSEISLKKLFEEEMRGRSGSVDYYLPIFLSVRGCVKRTDLQDQVVRGIKAYNKRRKPRIIRTKKEEEILKDIKYIKDYNIIDLISIDRACDYNEWIKVGWTLFNIGQGHEEALKLWIQFSRLSDKFVDGACEDEWSGMKLSNLGMGTLKWMARNDSPIEYRKIRQYSIRKLLEICLRTKKPAEYDVASVVCAKYQDRFKCDVISRKDVWYEFQDHRWKEIRGEISLRLLLPKEIGDEFGVLLQEYNNEYRSSGDEKYSVYIKRCLEIMYLLKTEAYQSKIIKQCKLKMFDGEFLKKMDENRELVGCENGVLDLRSGIFRPGEPEDYISFSTGLHYQEYSHGGPEDKELEEYLIKTFPNPNLRNYFQDFMCSCLRGGNVHKRFLVKTGNGDNGKSITVKFLELVFGEYCGKFPRELLVRGRGNSSGQARPELARTKGKRIMFCQEIGNSIDEINVGVLKELTGNDSFYVRTLFKEGSEIIPQFTLILQCISAGTAISLPCGISLPIETLKNNSKVLSWDGKGLIPTKQDNFLNQGVQSCVTLTLQDGREITCTPDHRFLNSKSEWVSAENIIIGKTSLLMGPHQPCYDLKDTEYIFASNRWDLLTLVGKLKAMAACRILGYGLADGSMNIQLYMGHHLDAEQVVNDIELLTEKRPKIGKCNNCFHIHIPRELTRVFNELCPAQPGGRLNNPMVFPKFIFDEDCPDFLIREFIAGLFGGDGILPRIQKNSNCSTSGFTPICLIASKTNKHIRSLVDEFKRLSDLLKNRFGITSNVGKPIEYEKGKNKVNLLIHRNRSARIFIEKIGMRYCCHKIYRLTAVLSYIRYKDSIIDQNNRILNRVNELVEKYKKQNPVKWISQFTKDGKLIRIHKRAPEAQHLTSINRKQISSACRRNGTSGGFVWKFSNGIQATTENESGCKTLKKALKKAISEQDFIFSKKDIITYSQICHRRHKGKHPNTQQVNNLLEYMQTTNLDNFCNSVYFEDSKKKIKYAVDINAKSLPTYNITVIGRKPAGKCQVYDLTIPIHANFIANGIVSHNCNDPPKIPGNDRATWARIRVLDYESTFIKPQDIDKDRDHIVPDTFRKQIKKKRFMADPCFEEKLPALAPVLLWKLFQRYIGVYKDRGLYEPEEVISSTDNYRTANDVYKQFISEKIKKIEDHQQAKESFIKLMVMFDEFKEWNKMNYPSYKRNTEGRIEMRNKLIKRLGGQIKNDKQIYGFKDSRWWGYKIIMEDDQDETPTKQRMLKMLGT